MGLETSAGVGPRNSSLNRAKRTKYDEHYTRIEDVEAELQHYREHFRDKTVYLNCDDPRWSAFWRYFCLRFGELGLERLIATHCTSVTAPGVQSFKIEALRGRDDTAGDGVRHVDPETGGVQTPLQGDGDFRSEECVELLKQSDIVVTNPPFSLFREYVAQLVEHGKRFVIIGNMNAITYKEIWPLIQANRLWLGVGKATGGNSMLFHVDSDYPDGSGVSVGADGKKTAQVAAKWFTNLEHKKHPKELELRRRYADTPEDYPSYDNYDGAIEVSRIKDIPADYDGVMGGSDNLRRHFRLRPWPRL